MDSGWNYQLFTCPPLGHGERESSCDSGLGYRTTATTAKAWCFRRGSCSGCDARTDHSPMAGRLPRPATTSTHTSTRATPSRTMAYVAYGWRRTLRMARAASGTPARLRTQRPTPCQPPTEHRRNGQSGLRSVGGRFVCSRVLRTDARRPFGRPHSTAMGSTAEAPQREILRFRGNASVKPEFNASRTAKQSSRTI